MNELRRVVLISNLYPDESDPAKGVFVRNIMCSLRVAGLVVDVIALRNTRGITRKMQSYGQFYWRVIQRLLQRDFDLAYLHYVSHCAPPILLSRVLGACPVIVSHVHGSDVIPEKGTYRLYAGAKRGLARRVLALSKKIIVPSAYFRSVLSEQYGIEVGRIHVSPSGGVDLEVFRPHADITVECPDFRLGYVGRLIEEKGILDFIELMRVLRGSGRDVKATVIGDGPLRHLVELVVAELDIEYLPRIEQNALADKYREMDLFVFSSRRKAESLGLVGIEAMACGVPVVAYRGTGPETYINDRISGFLVEPGDVNEMVEAVTQFMDSPPASRENMCNAALQSAQPFSAEQTRIDLLRALREAVE